MTTDQEGIRVARRRRAALALREMLMVTAKGTLTLYLPVATTMTLLGIGRAALDCAAPLQGKAQVVSKESGTVATETLPRLLPLFGQLTL